MNTKEIECRFLEIDKDSLIKKLISLGAEDLGEVMLEETIMYDKDLKWKEESKFIRLRKNGDKVQVSYKKHGADTVDGTEEIEIEVDDYKKAEAIFEKVGLVSSRHQQKKRHTFHLGNVTFDIDTWPRIPAYLEIEGESEEELKKAVAQIGYNWKDAIFNNAAWVIENKYNIPVRSMAWYTFDRFE